MVSNGTLEAWKDVLPPRRQNPAARAPQQQAEGCTLRPCLPATGATPQISRPVLGALMRWGARESYRLAIAGLLL
jgi:hypothetical protein